MQPEPIRPLETPSQPFFSRAWRGEIGLYRAAYGLGGLGLALVSLLADALISCSAATTGAIGWLSYIAGAAGELAFAWISIVATWRAAQKGRAIGNRVYGPLAVGVAFAFVATQFVLIAGWTGWRGLAELGLAPEPDAVLIRALAYAIGTDYGSIVQVYKALAEFVN